MRKGCTCFTRKAFLRVWLAGFVLALSGNSLSAYCLPERAAVNEDIPSVASPSNIIDQAWQILGEGVVSPNSDRRIDTIVALGTIGGNQRAIGLIVPCLEDREVLVRQAAAETLAKVHAITAIGDLTNALRDPSQEVRFAAALALMQLGSSAGRGILLDVLGGRQSASSGFVEGEKRDFKQKMHDHRFMIFSALEMGTGMMLPGADFGIGIVDGLTRDRSSQEKMSAANALASDHNEETLRQLIRALSDKNLALRKVAAQALGGRRDHSDTIVLNLQPSLRDPDLRYLAAASIVRLRSTR